MRGHRLHRPENRKAAFESYKGRAAEVQRGRAVIVCPEGTRGYDYHLRPFKKGPFVLAIAAQAPIVPTVVYGTREVMRKGSFWIRSGTVDLHFLEPVASAGCDYEHRGELMTTVWTRWRRSCATGMASRPTSRRSRVPASARNENPCHPSRSEGSIIPVRHHLRTVGPSSLRSSG
jgi:1-acyl-sn-glycerol-3-phosphate acyltransferase